jgi:hypothetical protein
VSDSSDDSDSLATRDAVMRCRNTQKPQPAPAQQQQRARHARHALDPKHRNASGELLQAQRCQSARVSGQHSHPNHAPSLIPGTYQLSAGGLIAFTAGRGRAWQGRAVQGSAERGGAGWGGEKMGRNSAANTLRWVVSVPPMHRSVFCHSQPPRWWKGRRMHGRQGTFPSCAQSRFHLLNAQPQVFRVAAPRL